jgi:hypothetical protein
MQLTPVVPILNTLDIEGFRIKVDIAGNKRESIRLTQIDPYEGKEDSVFIEKEIMGQTIISMLAIRNAQILNVTGELYGYNGRYICALQGQVDNEANLICVADLSILDIGKPPVDVYGQKIRVGDAISVDFKRLQLFSALNESVVQK